RRGTRLRTGLVIESGEPRDIHHMATLIGYGAAAINPYVMFESLDELADRSLLPADIDREEAEERIVKAIGKGLLKTISKMGISTIQSYCGAQIFEAVGLDAQVNDNSVRKGLLRGLMQLRPAGRQVPLDEVEPATEIVKRFTTGAMSLGALSREAHETLAIAMNRMGARSNTGEGGEDPARYMP